MARTAKVPLPERLRRAWPSTASAALLLLAFPPFNLGLLVFVALVPLLISLQTGTGKGAWRKGYGFGLLYGLGQLFWVAQLTAHWVGSIWMGILPWVLASVLYAIYFGWTAVLIRHAWNRNWPWAIPLLWAGVEVLRSFIPVFAFPWGLIATPLWPYTAIIQSARLGTIFLVSAWVVLASVVIAMMLVGTEYRKVRIPIAVFAAGAAMSFMVLGIDVKTEPFPVTIGQPGVDMAFGTPEKLESDLTENIDRISQVAASDGSRLLVLPEGVTVVPYMPPRPSFALRPGLPIIFGGRRGTSPAYQSAFGFDGRRWQHEDKTRLVIFGEYVPGREAFPFIAEAFRLPATDMVPGKEGVRAMDMPGVRVGPVVCFESVFPDVAFRQALNDARLLTVISIDDWFMAGTPPEQLRAGTIWRSVETGLPAVRAATLGYSFACDGHGRILASLPLRESRGLRVEVPVPTSSPTFKAAFAFPVVVGAFALVMPWLRKRV